jgi:hypothetical protein
MPTAEERIDLDDTGGDDAGPSGLEVVSSRVQV